jgi:hypothetical protein
VSYKTFNGKSHRKLLLALAGVAFARSYCTVPSSWKKVSHADGSCCLFVLLLLLLLLFCCHLSPDILPYYRHHFLIPSIIMVSSREHLKVGRDLAKTISFEAILDAFFPFESDSQTVVEKRLPMKVFVGID